MFGRKKKAKHRTETPLFEDNSVEEAVETTEEPVKDIEEDITLGEQLTIIPNPPSITEEPEESKGLAIDIELEDSTEEPAEKTTYLEDDDTGGIVGSMETYPTPNAQHVDIKEVIDKLCECDPECVHKFTTDGEGMFDILNKISEIYHNTTGTEEDKEKAVSDFIDHEVDLPDEDDWCDIKEIPIDKFMYCRDLLYFVGDSINRSINMMETKLKEADYEDDGIKIPETRGSKIFWICHLLRKIMDDIDEAKLYIDIDETGNYETVEFIVNLTRCAVALNDIVIRCGIVSDEAIGEKLTAHKNLRCAVESIVKRSDSTKKMASGLGILILISRVKVLKYQAMDVILGTAIEIHSFIENHKIGTDEDASRYGMDMEHLDEMIKCLADINKLI